jgi:transcriptional regulator with XRE-family HTH domain
MLACSRNTSIPETEVGLKLDQDRVRGTRERLGLTLAMVAQRAGTSKNTVLSAEHGADIRPTTARKIAAALGVEIVELLPEETESPLGQAAPSVQLTINGVLAEERRRPKDSQIKALKRHLAYVERQLDEDTMNRDEAEDELDIVLAFGRTVRETHSAELSARYLALAGRVLDKAKELKARHVAAAEGVLKDMREWGTRRAS